MTRDDTLLEDRGRLTTASVAKYAKLLGMKHCEGIQGVTKAVNCTD